MKRKVHNRFSDKSTVLIIETVLISKSTLIKMSFCFSHAGKNEKKGGCKEQEAQTGEKKSKSKRPI